MATILTAQAVVDTARTLLNDDTKAMWTDSKLLVLIGQAHREMQVKLGRASSPGVRKVSAAITITALATTITLPTDFVSPYMLKENSTGGGLITAVEMTEKTYVPSEAQAATLRYWTWADEAITFLGASADRDVFIYYKKRLTVPTALVDSLGIPSAEVFLAPRVAALGWGSLGNVEAYGAMNGIADGNWQDLLAEQRGQQNTSAKT